MHSRLFSCTKDLNTEERSKRRVWDKFTDRALHLPREGLFVAASRLWMEERHLRAIARTSQGRVILSPRRRIGSASAGVRELFFWSPCDRPCSTTAYPFFTRKLQQSRSFALRG